MSGAAPPTSFRRPSYTGERRVTVDLDDARPLDAARAFYQLRNAGAHEIDVRVSAGGEGFHVRAWFDAADVTALDVENLRLGAGDHPRRTFMDRDHKAKPQQVLFTRKVDAEAGPWRSDPWRAVDDFYARSDRTPDADDPAPYRVKGWFGRE